jgi:hypothetical protein
MKVATWLFFVLVVLLALQLLPGVGEIAALFGVALLSSLAAHVVHCAGRRGLPRGTFALVAGHSGAGLRRLLRAIRYPTRAGRGRRGRPQVAQPCGGASWLDVLLRAFAGLPPPVFETLSPGNSNALSAALGRINSCHPDLQAVRARVEAGHPTRQPDLGRPGDETPQK